MPLWKTAYERWEYFLPYVAIALGDTVEAQKINFFFNFLVLILDRTFNYQLTLRNL
jgi:hypothetical protein